MNFSKTASYSLNILSFMAYYDGINMSASFLHQELEIPYPYLRHILTDLSKNGFIHSVRGRRGGFTFSRRKEDVSLANILESTDGLEGLNRCILGFRSCPFNYECAMHSVWESTRSRIMKVLKETTLADISKKHINKVK